MGFPIAAALAALEVAQEEPPTPEEVQACGEDPSLVCTAVLEWTDNDVLAKAADVFVAKPLMIALIVAVAFVLNRLSRRAIRRFVHSFEQPEVQQRIGSLRSRAPSALLTTGPVHLRAAQRASTIGAVLRSVSGAVIWIFAAILVLGELGINLGPLIAGAGIAGVALGFGAQTLVRDFLTGMFMLIEDQFGVGDIIDVGEASGVVEGVSLRTTRLRDVQGTVWHVPNGEIKRVANQSQQWSRALVDFDVAYATDLELAKRVIKETADGVWRDPELGVSVLEEPEVWGVERFGPDGVAIRLVMKTRPADQWKVMRELRQRMKSAFDANGIEIPFPQRTIWVRPGEGAPTLPGTEAGRGTGGDAGGGGGDPDGDAGRSRPAPSGTPT